MALSLAVVAVIVGAVLSAGFWLALLERLDALSAVAILTLGALVLFGARGRRGAGWALARGAIIGAAIALTVVAVLFGACVATQCIR